MFSRRIYGNLCISCQSKLLQRNSFKSILHRRKYSSFGRPSKSSRPLRVAVIGSGPAGFYAAYKLMSKVSESVVDMYESLPVPYGLVRYGVAPDHPEVKKCEDTFAEAALSKRFNFIGNMAVGSILPLHLLTKNYDALLFAYGASKDRQLNIPGEDLRGIHSARAFVGWYNGLPEYAGLTPDLTNTDHAAIIGQGNVALDAARILLTPTESLRTTDMPEHALSALSRSRIQQVSIFGRRGPIQAAFTTKEVRELMRLPGVRFTPLEDGLIPTDKRMERALPRATRRIVQVLQNGSSLVESPRCSWSLRFMLAPTAFTSSTELPAELGGITFAQTEFVKENGRTEPTAQVRSTQRNLHVDTGFALRSIGYKAEPLPGFAEVGIPFDEQRGLIPNDGLGRVVAPNGSGSGPHSGEWSACPGLYCTGWVQSGPNGVIAHTMEDAFGTVEAIVKDWEGGAEFLSGRPDCRASVDGWDAIKADPILTDKKPISWEGWLKIDAAEKASGHKLGKAREKICSISKMLEAVG